MCGNMCERCGGSPPKNMRSAFSHTHTLVDKNQISRISITLGRSYPGPKTEKKKTKKKTNQTNKQTTLSLRFLDQSATEQIFGRRDYFSLRCENRARFSMELRVRVQSNRNNNGQPLLSRATERGRPSQHAASPPRSPEAERITCSAR